MSSRETGQSVRVAVAVAVGEVLGVVLGVVGAVVGVGTVGAEVLRAACRCECHLPAGCRASHRFEGLLQVSRSALKSSRVDRVESEHMNESTRRSAQSVDVERVTTPVLGSPLLRPFMLTRSSTHIRMTLT